MGSKESQAERAPGPDQHPSMTINGATREGAENRMLQEWHYYFQNTLRWRNLRKITVAQVQGTVYAAGLMLMWACDLIVAADDVYFADVVGTRLGMCGVEYFGHPWEFGPRRTKELMLTGDAIDVHEAHRLGMVSKVFPVDDLAERTLAYARRIAQLPTMSALLIKESVNQTVDNMGFYNSLQACFTPPPAQPLPLGGDPRVQVPGGRGAGRRPELACRAAGAALGEGPGGRSRSPAAETARISRRIRPIRTAGSIQRPTARYG